MEEQRQRQQDDARRGQTTSETPTAGPPTSHEVSSDEAMLERALAMSIEDSSTSGSSSAQPEPDFSAMTEDEQIAFALRMSMQDAVAARTYIRKPILTVCTGTEMWIDDIFRRIIQRQWYERGRVVR